jgi:hypothetical protein
MDTPAMEETVLISTSALLTTIHAPRTPPAQTNQDHMTALATLVLAVTDGFVKILTNAVLPF